MLAQNADNVTKMVGKMR